MRDALQNSGDRLPPALRVAGISKSFGQRKVLTEVSFDLAQREIIGVIGPSGAGKTTLLRCLNLLAKPDSGVIEYRDLQRIDAGQEADLVSSPQATLIRRQVGLVFQGFNLWEDRTVLENLILAPRVVHRMAKAEAAGAAETLCAEFGMTHHINHRIWQLSGGQRQRVAIIRALMMQPQLLLLDEITSALDPLLAAEVLDSIRHLRTQGRTMVIVTHHMDFATALCDRLMYLEDGRVIQLDTPGELRSHPKTENIRRFLEILRSTH